eukprot:4179256-Pleurochrysis_carterae.AAC.1
MMRGRCQAALVLVAVVALAIGKTHKPQLAWAAHRLRLRARRIALTSRRLAEGITIEVALGEPCGRKCINKGRCGDALTKNELYKCHEVSYGTTQFNESSEKWETSMEIRETQDSWRKLMSTFTVYDDSNVARFAFTAASRVVCEDFARVAYGISQFAWNTNMAFFRSGPNALAAAAESKPWQKSARQAMAREKTTSQFEAVAWWMQILPLWDAIPNEFIIKHPRLVWDRLY